MIQRQDDVLTVLLTSGFLTVPSLLLQSYKQLGLSDEEMMLVMHLFQFRQEGVEFPTPAQIGQRMSVHEDMLMSVLGTLQRMGFLEIGEDQIDLHPLYRKLIEFHEPKQKKPLASLDLLEKKEQNPFTVFEQEFGRPLSPLECEMIIKWMDEDRYREELIREALREAVLSGKFNFKYIDRILFEWQKVNIRTLQELNVHREQYRNRMPGSRQRQGQQQSRQPSSAQQQSQQRPGSAPAQEQDGQENKYDAFYRMYGRE
ncbi:DnaD domain-containing protein [Tumebacillus permanentifrigoris]|uniref:DNA replication protein n=1 Tax=Tumebacillus permanentifrigoris TaxID=378543 RepID=A0A316DBS8_9BACL|nr:DnaD domain protein [Tumebacillus permanentifrigoris]PWK15597.1 DNA replication protein [Tumebacillus permanentifrigoris]